MNWYYYDNTNNLILNIYVQTGAKNTVIAGLHGEYLKIRLAAAPIEGKANSVLVKFIAECFGVPSSKVILKRGDRCRQKTIIIQQPSYHPETLLSELQN
ncbi:MAG: YggU family protein [Nitrosomonas sp. PRO4]|nr:YggU family protein [Nitrosomonas sp. PRO4]